MKTFLALVGLLAIFVLATRWIRLMWFRASTLRVITRDLAYDAAVPGFQSPTFNTITRQARASGGNEYDAAIAFMLVQLGCLSEPLDSRSVTFAGEKLQLIHRIAHMAPQGNSLVREFLQAKQWRQEHHA